MSRKRIGWREGWGAGDGMKFYYYLLRCDDVLSCFEVDVWSMLSVLSFLRARLIIWNRRQKMILAAILNNKSMNLLK